MMMKATQACLLFLLFGASACASGRSDAEAVLPQIETPFESIGLGASTLATFRMAVEDSSQAARLLSAGTAGAEVAAERLADPNLANADQAISVYAYVIEKMRYADAVPVLEQYILGGPGTRHHFWAPHFVVRALLVLKGERDPMRGYEEYSDAEVARALRR